MMRSRSRADVATFQCRDVETSRRFHLLTSAMLTQRRDAETSRRGDVATWGRRDVGTSRRGDVATWGRRDVGTSRRDSHFLALVPIAPKLLLRATLFARMYLYPSKTPNQEPGHKTMKLL